MKRLRETRNGWLRIFLLMSLHALHTLSAATLNVTGVSEEEREEVTSILTPRLEYILERDASPWRADDAAFLLKRLMIRRGYPEVKVDWTLSGSNIIDLKVTPGVLYRFGQVTSLKETEFSAEALREYFLQPLVDTESVRSDEAPYIEQYVEKGATNVENHLKSLGYWNATVSVEDEITDTEEKEIDVNLQILAGNLLTLSQPKFEGARQQNLTKLTPALEEFVGEAATTQNIKRMKRVVEKYYEDNGYQFAKVKLGVKHQKKQSQLSFVIQEGEQYKVNKIVIKGVEKTKPKRISRYFRRQKGENYDKGEIDRIVTRIIQTGGFSSLVVRPVPLEDTNEGLVDLHVTVSEAKAKKFRGYTGFGNFEGPIIGAGYSDSNFNGDLRRLYYGAEYSGRGILGEVGIMEPRVFNSPLDANIRLFVIDRFNEGYDVRKAGLESSLTWSPSRKYLTRFYANATYAVVSTDSMSDTELGPNEYFVNRFGIEQTLDLRNDKLLPADGYHGRLLLETGAINGEASTGFLRSELENSFRYSLNDKNQFLVRFLVSALKAEELDDLPIDIRLFSGGVNSQRAYTERELGPQSSSGDPLGGEAYWVGSLEYIRSLRGPVKAVVFADAGKLFNEIGDFSLGGASYAAGLGLRIDLPIGPIRLEYGSNLNRKSGEPGGTFHFSIGASF